MGITVNKDGIFINGEKTKIISGAFHYFRVFPEYWHDRLLKMKECGLNCVETYVCWNLHEKEEGVFDFSGDLDFGAFIDEAAKLGLFVIVRPGPYICSEWDFGGMPWWLLKNPEIVLRSSDESFMSKAKPYLVEVCKVLKPRLISSGGNVIFVQIENEYGTFAGYLNDENYLRGLKKIYEDEGIDCAFITSDPYYDALYGTLPDIMPSINYRKESRECIEWLKSNFPDYPPAVMELWNGKQQHFAEKKIVRDVEEVKRSVKEAVELADLVNLYMFCGGTNFGFYNGANAYGKNYIIQHTSYSVDAPINEYGKRTEKYYAEREAICECTGKTPPLTACDPVLKEYGKAAYKAEMPLFDCLDEIAEKKFTVGLKNTEFLGQGFGYTVYQTRAIVRNIPDRPVIKLTLPEVKDFASVYINGKFVKSFKRGYDEDREIVVAERGEITITIFVENMGRVNHCDWELLPDRKGLLGVMKLDGRILFNYDCYLLPLDKLPVKIAGKAINENPAFYEYTFSAEKRGDTIMKLFGFTRGVAFINGFNLGRFWTYGDEENALFVPARLIKKGENRVIVFDVFANDENEKRVVFDR